jgi:hypothetical protein
MTLLISTITLVRPTMLLQSVNAAGIDRVGVGADVTAGGGTASLVELEKSARTSAPVATSGDNVYVSWPSDKTGDFEIMFRVSTDNAKTFGPKVNLSDSTGVISVDEKMAASGNKVYVRWWEEQKNGTREPMFIASDDNGKTFGESSAFK